MKRLSLAAKPRAASRAALRTEPANAAKPRGARPAALRVEPVTAANWSDLEQLFGPKGACGGCWCMFMRLPLAAFRRGKGDGNRRALCALVKRRPPGLIAYAGAEPVGWIAVAPREEYVRLQNSRVLEPVPGEGVWAAPCFYVKAGHRGAGVSGVLLAAATEFARRHGAQSLEGYPHTHFAEKQPAAFVWTGFESTFRRAGFTEIARRTPKRPILRRELEPGAARRGRATGSARAPVRKSRPATAGSAIGVVPARTPVRRG